jgi:hypothetical protein
MPPPHARASRPSGTKRPDPGFLDNPPPRLNDADPRRSSKTETSMRYGLLWLLGVPIPLLIVIWLLFN